MAQFLLAFLVFGLGTGVEPRFAGASAASILAKPAVGGIAAEQGVVLWTQTFALEGAEKTVLSNDPTGASAALIDDVLDVRVTRANGTTSEFSVDFSDGCAPLSARIVDLTPYLADGRNTITLSIRDQCGSLVGNTELWLARPTPTISRSWVALGDSYSSGEGVGDVPFDLGTETNGDGPRCHRSPLAWPRVAARRIAEVVVNKDRFATPIPLLAACSGATTAHFDSASLHGDQPQFSKLDATTKIVTLTIGGNDVNFGGVLRTCILPYLLTAGTLEQLASQGRSLCKQTAGREAATKLRELPSTLHTAYSKLKEKLGDAGADARVIVVGYPSLFPPGRPSFCGAISIADAMWLRSQQELLNRTIRQKAKDFNFEFVPTEGAFDEGGGHDSCPSLGGRKELWMHNLATPLEFSFHPNAEGHRQIARLVADVLAAPADRTTVTVSPRQTVTQDVKVISPAGARRASRGPGGTLTVDATWSTGRTKVTLTSPSGQAVDQATDAVEISSAQRWQHFVVHAPEPGTWTISLTGGNDFEGPSEVSVRSTVDLTPSTTPPTALASMSTSSAFPGGPIEFDGEGSFDIDGVLNDVRWEFGDGETARGAAVSHAFRAAGTYVPALTVTDSDGLSDTYVLEPITVLDLPITADRQQQALPGPPEASPSGALNAPRAPAVPRITVVSTRRTSTGLGLLKLRCSSTTDRCRGRASYQAAGRTRGTRYSIAAGRTTNIRIRLIGPARKRSNVVIKLTPAAGQQTSRKTIVLRR